MKKLIIHFVLLVICSVAQAQFNATPQSITFEVEKLSLPNALLPAIDKIDLVNSWKVVIEKTSPMPDEFAYVGEYPILYGYIDAYKAHRPITITPDMIWLLICQGFSQHLNNNSELLRKQLVNFEGKKTLTVREDSIKIGNKDSPWENVFPKFTALIAAETSEELINTLTADFSTSTPTTKIVSQIVAMDAVKPYFDYEVAVSCGIPKVTLEGTSNDWEILRTKTKILSKYHLNWWTKELDGILKEFKNTAKGKVNLRFWRKMIKIHEGVGCGAPDEIDGWFIKFFPYTSKGERANLNKMSSGIEFPSELSKIPFILNDLNTNKKYKMEFWAGFTGLTQKKEDFTLVPQIGWAIINLTFSQNYDLKSQNHIHHNITLKEVDELPSELFNFHSFNMLTITFLNGIKIPARLAKIPIDILDVSGTISKEEETRIREIFPRTIVVINGRNGVN